MFEQENHYGRTEKVKVDKSKKQIVKKIDKMDDEDIVKTCDLKNFISNTYS